MNTNPGQGGEHPPGAETGTPATTADGAKAGFSVRRLVPILIIVAVAGVVLSQGWHRYIGLEQIAENRTSLAMFVADQYALAILAYVALYVAVVALSLPGGALLTITGGFLFGWLAGGLATVLAATAGATLIFLIAKTSLGEPLAARAGPWLARLRAGLAGNALNYLLFLRLVPVFPFWLVNLAPALLGVPLPTYVLGTFIGIIPGTFAFAFLGAGLDGIITAQRAVYEACLAGGAASAMGDTMMTEIMCDFEFSPGAVVTTPLLLAFTLLGVVALIPVALRTWRNRRARASGSGGSPPPGTPA